MRSGDKGGSAAVWPTWKGATGKDRCGYCGAKGPDAESGHLMVLVCPECGRNGCHECMPAGRSCICPECEEARYVE